MTTPGEFEAASCTGKVRFASYDAAARVQRRRGRNKQFSKGQAYRCRTCRGWHIGNHAEEERPKHEFRRFRERYEDAR